VDLVDCIVIEKGEPYETGSCIKIETEEIFIGRTSDSVAVDINFSNYLISRRHCCIRCCGDKISLYDLGSKHGTQINGNPISANVPYLLSSGDKISLAMGIVVVRFVQSGDFEKTMDFSNTLEIGLKSSIQPITMDVEKRECFIAGRSISLTGKEWDFLSLLYKNVNKMVTYNEIKLTVWPERSTDQVSIPDVGMDEMNVLIYRLRRKMGKQSKIIKTIRGCGCIIDI
jgi:DNA-binding winged helix-turn-helix (wHTH) protein